MKTIIISDIESKEKSIIPYGLNFAKNIDDQVTVIHAIDPRKQQAVSSAYADSQSFEVGRKLTYYEILEREKNQAIKKLDKILSKEASRLNYPLRVNTNVEKTSLSEQLNTALDKDSKGFLITSNKADGVVFDNLNEFFNISNNFENISLIVPPGMDFKPPKKAMLLFDFNTDNNECFFDIIKFLTPFNLVFNVTDVARNNNDIKKNLLVENWKQSIKDKLRSKIEIKTTLLQGENYLEAILDHIKWTHYDLVIVPGKNGTSNNKKLFSEKFISQLINGLNTNLIIF